MTRARDTQRKKLYTAEREVFGFDQPKLELNEIRALMKRITESKRVVNAHSPNGSVFRVTLGDGRACRRAVSFGGEIAMPRWSRMTWIVLHEMAHEVHRYRHEWYKQAWHGWEYASVYLDLVMWFMGREDHDKLKANFKKHKVRFNERRKGRALSEEQRQVLRDRLAAARAMRAGK